MHQKQLVQFGLTGIEADLYLYLLENGDSPVNEIASETTIGRTNIYEYAKSLKEKGLVTDYERSKKIFYHAESPSVLNKKVEKIHDDAEALENTYKSIFPKLEDYYIKNSHFTPVKRYIGDEGFRKVMNMIYLEGADNDLCIILSNLDLYEPPEPRYRSSIQNRRLISHIFANKKQITEDFLKRDERELRKTHILEFEIKEDIIIFENLCFIGDFNKNNFKMTCIENPSLAMLLKCLLDIK